MNHHLVIMNSHWVMMIILSFLQSVPIATGILDNPRFFPLFWDTWEEHAAIQRISSHNLCCQENQNASAKAPRSSITQTSICNTAQQIQSKSRAVGTPTSAAPTRLHTSKTGTESLQNPPVLHSATESDSFHARKYSRMSKGEKFTSQTLEPSYSFQHNHICICDHIRG